jgi:hypothetical protein
MSAIDPEFREKLRRAIEVSVARKEAYPLENFYDAIKQDPNYSGVSLPYFKFNPNYGVVEYDPTHPFFDTQEAWDVIPFKNLDQSEQHFYYSPYKDPLTGMVTPRYRTRRDFWDALAGKTWKEYLQEVLKEKTNFSGPDGLSIADLKAKGLTPRQLAKAQDYRWLSQRLGEVLGIGTPGINTLSLPASQVVGNSFKNSRNTMHALQTLLAGEIRESAIELARAHKQNTGKEVSPFVVSFGRDMENMDPYVQAAMSDPAWKAATGYDYDPNNILNLEVNREVGGTGGNGSYQIGAESFQNKLEKQIDSAYNNNFLSEPGRHRAHMIRRMNRDIPFPLQDPAEFLRSLATSQGNRKGFKALVKTPSNDESALLKLFNPNKTPNNLSFDKSLNYGGAVSAAETNATVLNHIIQQHPQGFRLLRDFDTPTVFTDTGYGNSVPAAVQNARRWYSGMQGLHGNLGEFTGPVIPPDPNNPTEFGYRMKGGIPAPLADSIMLYSDRYPDSYLLNRLKLNSFPKEWRDDIKELLSHASVDKHGEGMAHPVGATKALTGFPTHKEMFRLFKISPEYMEAFSNTVHNSRRFANKDVDTDTSSPIPVEDLAAGAQSSRREPLGPTQVSLAREIPAEFEALRQNNQEVWENAGNLLGPIMKELPDIPKDWASKASPEVMKVADTPLYAMSHPLGAYFTSGGQKALKRFMEPSERYGNAKGSALLRSMAAPLMGGIGAAGEEYKRSNNALNAIEASIGGTAMGALAGKAMSLLPGLGGALMGFAEGDKVNKYLGDYLNPSVAKALGGVGMLGAEIAAPEFFVPATIGMGAYEAVKPWYDILTGDSPAPKPKLPIA